MHQSHISIEGSGFAVREHILKLAGESGTSSF